MKNKYIYREIKIRVGANHPTFTKYFGMKNNCRFLFGYEERGSLFKILEQVKIGETPNNFDNTSCHIILVRISSLKG